MKELNHEMSNLIDKSHNFCFDVIQDPPHNYCSNVADSIQEIVLDASDFYFTTCKNISSWNLSKISSKKIFIMSERVRSIA